MSSSVLRSMLIHTCTITKASRTSSGSSSYGHSGRSFTSPESTLTSVQCRLKPISVTEEESRDNQGRVIADHYLYIMAEDMPTALLAANAETIYRISNVVRTRNGATIDAGPFDINAIEDQAGEGHHYRLTLRRTA